jgi:hypothetical protein
MFDRGGSSAQTCAPWRALDGKLCAFGAFVLSIGASRTGIRGAADPWAMLIS